MATIYAVEGPSGSGKSRIVRELRQQFEKELISDIVFLERPRQPRLMGAGRGAWSSSYLEYMAISAAIMMPEADYVVDRFLLSSWVYRGMLFNDNVLLPGWRYDMEESFYGLQNLAQSEANLRIANGFQYRPNPMVFITVLLPALERLLAQRKSAFEKHGTQYPFDAAVELELYTEMTRRLQEYPIGGIIVLNREM